MVGMKTWSRAVRVLNKGRISAGVTGAAITLQGESVRNEGVREVENGTLSIWSNATKCKCSKLDR